MKNHELVRAQRNDRVSTALFVGELDQKGVLAISIEMLHDSPDLPSSQTSVWQILGKGYRCE